MFCFVRGSVCWPLRNENYLTKIPVLLGSKTTFYRWSSITSYTAAQVGCSIIPFISLTCVECTGPLRSNKFLAYNSETTKRVFWVGISGIFLGFFQPALKGLVILTIFVK